MLGLANNARAASSSSGENLTLGTRLGGRLALRVFGRLPGAGARGCTEAGVRKASREETARGVLVADGSAAQGALSGIIGQADAAIAEEAGEGGPALEHIIDGFWPDMQRPGYPAKSRTSHAI
jgi:hypothetical protein